MAPPLTMVVKYTCYKHEHSLLDLFRTACRHVFLGLTTWYWIDYQGAHPWGRLILPLSLWRDVNCL